MSGFWDRLGKVADAAEAVNPVNGVQGVFDIARTMMTDNSDSSPLMKFFSAEQSRMRTIGGAFDNPVGGAVKSGLGVLAAPVIWTGQQASHGLAAAWNVGDIAEAHGGSQLTPLWTGQDWKNAWNETSGIGGPGEGPNLGESVSSAVKSGTLVTNSVQGGMFASTPQSQQQRKDFEVWRRTTAGQISSGAIDIAATWYADPTVFLGKGAKIARIANTVEDATRAEQVSKAYVAGDKAVGKTGTAAKRGTVFATSNEERANRLAHLVASTDNKATPQIAAQMKPLLDRANNAAPIVDLWGQAGKISDLAVQRQVKADVLLAAMGSASSRQRLVESAPAIARAMQRTSSAPEEFAALDALASNADVLYSRGDSLTAAARALGQDTGNAAELKSYGQDLDRIHRHLRDLGTEAEFGGVTQVGANTLDRVKAVSRGATADQFYYAQGTSGRLVRVLHWGVDQRSRGSVNTADEFLGHEELLDHVARSKLFSGQERAQISERWFKANGQSLRNKVVDDLWDDTIRRVAVKHDMSVEDVNKLVDETKKVRGAASKYTTEALEKARKEGKSRVTIEDPVTHEATEVDAGLYGTHIRKNVALPDVQMIEHMVRNHADKLNVSDRMRQAEENLIGTVGPINDIWRLAVLARGGLFFRTQLDTQARVAAMIGTTNVFSQAIKGSGHLIGKVLHQDQAVQVAAHVKAIAAHDDAITQAAELRRQAGLLSGDKGTALLARADQMEASAQDALRTVTANRTIGASDQSMKLSTGQKVPFRAYEDASDEAATRSALYPGGSLSDAMTHMAGNKRAQYIENSRDYITHMPDSEEWVDGYIRGVDPMLGSYSGRKILQSMDQAGVDIVAALRHDPKVRAEWLNVRFDNPRMDDWIDRAVKHAQSMAPTKSVRDMLLSGKRLDHATVDKLFQPRGTVSPGALAGLRKPFVLKHTKAEDALAQDVMDHGIPRRKDAAERRAKLTAKRDEALKALNDFDAKPPAIAGTSDLPNRMPVQGPSFSPWAPSSKNPIVRVMRNAVSLMSDLPDEALGRHPMYVNRYYKHTKQLAERRATQIGELDAKEQAAIHKIAKHRAIKDVQQTLYDTARYTGAHHGVMRIVSPFLNAWEDAAVSWGRIMYDDPQKWGALVKTWTAPEHLGLVVDQDGNRVHPGQRLTAGGQKVQASIPIPLPGPIKGLTGVKEFRLSKDSINSVFQGEVPWLPGFGPLASVPAQQIVTRAFPELGDPNGPVPKVLQPFMRSLLNGDAPKVRPGPKGVVTDSLLALAPSWLQKMGDALDSTSPAFTNVYQDSFNSQVVLARRNGEQPNFEKINEKALKAARNTSIFRGLALGLFGMSGEGAGVAEFYQNQYRGLMRQQAQIEAQGKTVEQVFNTEFPEAAGLRFGVSFTDTGINPYLKTEDRAKTFSKDIQKNNEFAAYYVGADNVASGGKDEFSPSIYNAQSSRLLKPGSRDTQRGRITPAEMASKTQAGLGWAEYQRAQTKIDLILESRGLHSISQKGAEDLKAIKSAFVTQLSDSNHAWRDDYTSFDSGKLDRFITDVAEPSFSDPRLKNRSDVQATKKYLDYRTKAMALAKENGYSLESQQGATLRAVLDQVGTDLARDNIGFSQTWTKWLSREVSDG